MLFPELDSAREVPKYMSDRWHAMCGLSWKLHTDLASGNSTGLMKSIVRRALLDGSCPDARHGLCDDRSPCDVRQTDEQQIFNTLYLNEVGEIFSASLIALSFLRM